MLSSYLQLASASLRAGERRDAPNLAFGIKHHGHGELNRAQPRRGHAGIRSVRLHRYRSRIRIRHPENSDVEPQRHGDTPESGAEIRTQGEQRAGNSKGRERPTQDPLHFPSQQQAAIELRARDQPEGIRTEQQAELLRRQTEPLHEHERRARDVREHARVRGPTRERVTQERAICQHAHHCGLLRRRHPRFGKLDVHGVRRDQTEDRQQAEQRAPACNSGDKAADCRRQDRRDTHHEHQHREDTCCFA